MNEITKNRRNGGHGVMDIPLYMQLFFVQQIKQYVKAKTEGGSRPLHLFFYGILLSQLAIKNCEYSFVKSCTSCFQTVYILPTVY